jgi:Zn-dependent metalloprotease
MLISGCVLERAPKAGGGAADGLSTALSFLRANQGILGLDDTDNELQLERTDSDELGRRHFRFSQRYAGLPVWPAELILHTDPQGSVDLLNGAFVRTPKEADLEPSLTPHEAVGIARSKVPDGEAAKIGGLAIIIYAPLDAAPRLAWKLQVAPSLVSRWLVVVDAITGEVLSSFNQVMDANRAGSGVDLFGNTRPLNVWEEGGFFYLLDTSKVMFNPALGPISTQGSIIILDANNHLPLQILKDFR